MFPTGSGQNTPIFGGKPVETNPMSFGSNTNTTTFGSHGFGKQPTNAIFPQQTSQNTSSSMFTGTGGFGAASANAPLFGQPAGQSANVQPAFGFGQTSSFQQTTISPSLFGQNTQPSFGQTAFTQSAAVNPSNVQSSTFGQPSFSQPSFGQSPPSFSQSSGFGGTTLLGQKDTANPQPGNASTQASFTPVFPVQSTSLSTNVFGASPKTMSSSLFGGQTKMTTAGSISCVKTESSMFGGVGAPTSVFGGTNTDQKFQTQNQNILNTGATFPVSSTGALFGGSVIKSDSSGQTEVNPFKDEGSIKSGLLKQLSPPSTKFITAPTFSTGAPAGATASQDTTAASSSDSYKFPVKSELKTESDSLFGKKTERSNVLFGRRKSSDTSHTKTSTGLFGKSAQPEQKKQLFGKEPKQEEAGNTASGSQSTGLFGKAARGDTRKEGRKTSDDSDEAPQAKRTSIRRLSSVTEDKLALSCSYMPANLNNKLFLKKHFSKFGEVTRVYPNPTKKYAVVHFKTHDQALKAKKYGTLIRRDLPPIKIFWRKYSGQAQAASPPAEKPAEKSPIKRRVEDTKNEDSKSQTKWLKNEVEDELAGMSGTHDIGDIQTIERPEESKVRRPVTSRRQLSPSRQTRASSPVPSTSSSSSDPPGEVKLDSWKSLTSSVSHTSAEKVQILKLRDRIVRHGIKKQSDVTTAKAFIGTCQDMCPEKERYDREDKRRLHNFEILSDSDQNPGQNPRVDHSRAVKEYSRSSADQEEPLPHELRPLPVLKKTMLYLLSEIADQGGDGQWEGWFDFLWNRTRGIRKDLTQQQICDPGAAELLEKCVRFHVFCAERLAEEDMHAFDAKINNENMTKCLQTLKEIYHDLQIKHHTYCPNEAEMRAYMVLMNLNEGDILRETQQLRNDVRNSECISFALEVYSALNSNNYVKFFKLVRVGSFLNACIMHRYFTQVRSKALQTILKSHRKAEQFSTDMLVHILGFEDPIEASEFCQFYGLKADEMSVTLDKTRYIDPEESWMPRRAQNLIESKQMVAIGQVINGEALEPYTISVPYSSFDAHGKFVGKIDVKPSYLTSRTQVSSSASSLPHVEHLPSSVRAVQPEQQTAIRPIQSITAPVPTKLAFTNNDVKELAKQLFWEVIDEFCSGLAGDTMASVEKLKDLSQSICNDIVDDVVKDNVAALSKAMYSEIQVLRLKQQKAEKEAMLVRAAVNLTSEIIKEVTDQEVLNLATAEIREVKAELKRQQIARCSAEVSEEVLMDTVDELAAMVAEEVFQTDVTERLEELAEKERCVQLQIAGRFFQYWKKVYVARLKLKRSMLTFPSTPSMLSPGNQVDTLIPERRMDGIVDEGFYLSCHGQLSVLSAVEISNAHWMTDKVLTAHALYRKMCKCKAWQPYDVPKLIGRSIHRQLKRRLKGKLPSTVYWKLLLSLPDHKQCRCPSEQQAIEHLNSWLRAKFTKGSKTNEQGEVLSAYKADLVPDSDIPGRIGVCVRSLTGVVDADDRTVVEALMGTSAILFVLPPGVDDDPDSEYWNSAKDRLNSILEAKPRNPKVSVAIMCPVTPDQSMLTDNLGYERGIEKCLDLDLSLVGDVYIMDVDYSEHVPRGFDLDDLTAAEELGDALQWLGDHFPKSPDLKVSYVRDLVDDFVLKHFYAPVLQNLKQRKLKGFVHQKPSDLLTLYKDIIRHLVEVLSSQDMMHQSWPVPEFSNSNLLNGLPPANWNDESQLEYVNQVISSLELPWLQDMDLENADWSEVCKEIWAFIGSVTAEDQDSAKMDLASKVRILLTKARTDFENTCYLMEGEDRCEPSSDNVHWTDLITACIDYRLVSTDFTDAQEEEEDKELQVVYFESKLHDYRPPQGWRYLESDRDMTGMTSLNTTVKTAVDKLREKQLEVSLSRDNVVPEVSSTSSFIDLETMTEEEMADKKKADSLLEIIAAERRESQKFEQYLRNLSSDILETSAVPVECFPVENDQTASFNSKSVCEPSLGSDTCTLNATAIDARVSVLESELTLHEKLSKLEEEIASLKKSDELFEQQLKLYLKNEEGYVQN